MKTYLFDAEEFTLEQAKAASDSISKGYPIVVKNMDSIKELETISKMPSNYPPVTNNAPFFALILILIWVATTALLFSIV